MEAPLTETERIVRIFHESWDLRDPERGAAVIDENSHHEDMARGELQVGPEGYKRDYHRLAHRLSRWGVQGGQCYRPG